MKKELSMIRKLGYDQVVEAIDGLSAEDQAEIMHLIRRRLAEHGRRQVIADVVEGREERASGRAELLDIDELARDLHPKPSCC